MSILLDDLILAHFVSEGRRLAIAVCGRVHRGPACDLRWQWLQSVVETSSLFHSSL